MASALTRMLSTEMTRAERHVSTYINLNRATVLLAEGKLQAATEAWELADDTGELINEVRAPTPCVRISVHNTHGELASAFAVPSGA